MRIFKNLSEMYKEVEREIKHNGLVIQSSSVQDLDVRNDTDYKNKELVAYSYTVKDTSDRDEWLESLGKNLAWANADFQERIQGGINPGEAYKLRDVWEQFVHGGRFSYTYSERMKGKIDDIVNVLSKDRSSRQGVMTIYESPTDDLKRANGERIPCSMYYHFILRNNQLDVIYNMRSCDFNEHLPYDVWMACNLRDLIAERVGVKPGAFTHQISSLHSFYKDNKEIF